MGVGDVLPVMRYTGDASTVPISSPRTPIVLGFFVVDHVYHVGRKLKWRHVPDIAHNWEKLGVCEYPW